MIGSFARARSAQMNFCYTEALAENPKLAGAVAVALTITSAGDVTEAEVVRRSWSGRGTDVLEACILARVRTWKFQESDAPTGTYPFSLSFTK
jgi:TonB family protein